MQIRKQNPKSQTDLGQTEIKKCQEHQRPDQDFPRRLTALCRHNPDQILRIRCQPHTPAKKHREIHGKAVILHQISKTARPAASRISVKHLRVRQKSASLYSSDHDKIDNHYADREHDEVAAVRLGNRIESSKGRIQNKQINQKNCNFIINI